MSLPNLTPLPPDLHQIAEHLGQRIDRDQALWLSGYFAGISQTATGVAATPAVAAAPAAKANLTILYGTESGNAEKLAAELGKKASKGPFKAKVINMADSKPADLARQENLLVIVSTWGEGDPPDSVTSYYEEFMGKEAGDLSKVKFSVCALGDSSYEQFCKIGKDFDQRLQQLGAQRVIERVDCDVDYQASFDKWAEAALTALAPANEPAAAAAVAAPNLLIPATSATYDKEHPYESELKEKILLNGTGSAKETWHVELSLEGSGLNYEPGDALGIYPENRASDIEAVLAATGLSANASLGASTLAEALRHDFDITSLSPAIALKYNALVQHPDLTKALEPANKEALKEWMHGRQLIDLLETYPHTGWTPESFTAQLRKLNARLYSIASSLKAHEDEVHLTIAAVRYDTHGRDRVGVCSTYVADQLHIGDKARVYFHKNNNFRLPADDKTPIIMVGPGTGVAPFRAFIEERAAREATGKSWLFFGDQRFSYDFLYQLEWQDYLKDGALTELSTAFSRDQKHKVYVQDRLRERGADIYRWLEEGAHFYVCGDATRMAKDVQQALLDLIAEHGKKTPEEAKAYLDGLRKNKRYQRDVY